MLTLIQQLGTLEQWARGRLPHFSIDWNESGNKKRVRTVHSSKIFLLAVQIKEWQNVEHRSIQ